MFFNGKIYFKNHSVDDHSSTPSQAFTLYYHLKILKHYYVPMYRENWSAEAESLARQVLDYCFAVASGQNGKVVRNQYGTQH
jgi:hypothetical protein